MKEIDKNEHETAVNYGLGVAGKEVVTRYGSAASQYIKGYTGEIGPNGKLVKGLKQINKSKVNPNYQEQNLKQQAGYAAEVHSESKRNAENIIKGNSNRTRRTDGIGDVNHTEFDHVTVDKNGNPVLDERGNYTGTSQMKMRGKTGEANVQQLAQVKEFNKYKNANHLDIPKEQFADAKKFLTEKQNSLHKQIEELEKHGDSKALQVKQEELMRYESIDKRVRDSGITIDEALKKRNIPKWETTKEVNKVALRAGWEQAKYGAIIGGSVSIAKNIVAIRRGEEVNLEKVALNVTKDTASAASLSFMTGYSGTIISSVMQRSGSQLFQNLSKSNFPALIATTTLEVSKSVKRYLNEDDFGELQLIEELGEKGTGMMAASIGASVGSVVPVVGTVIGGMVGYMVGSAFYNSSLDILKEERLSDQKRKEVEKLSLEAITSMRKQQTELQAMISEHFQDQQKAFDTCFMAIDKSIETGSHIEFITNINKLAITFGVTLKLTNFNEFDDFMVNDNEEFVF